MTLINIDDTIHGLKSDGIDIPLIIELDDSVPSSSSSSSLSSSSEANNDYKSYQHQTKDIHPLRMRLKRLLHEKDKSTLTRDAERSAPGLQSSYFANTTRSDEDNVSLELLDCIPKMTLSTIAEEEIDEGSHTPTTDAVSSPLCNHKSYKADKMKKKLVHHDGKNFNRRVVRVARCA